MHLSPGSTVAFWIDLYLIFMSLSILFFLQDLIISCYFISPIHVSIYHYCDLCGRHCTYSPYSHWLTAGSVFSFVTFITLRSLLIRETSHPRACRLVDSINKYTQDSGAHSPPLSSSLSPSSSSIITTVISPTFKAAFGSSHSRTRIDQESSSDTTERA